MKKNKNIYIGIFILVVLLLMIKQEPTIPIVEGGWDISEQVAEQNYEQFLKEEPDFDYSHPKVLELAKEIKSSTSTPEEAIKKTIKLVANRIDYSSQVSVDYCYNEKASTVLESGMGDCVSSSRLVTALLRAQGIPARTMGGCLSLTKKCIAVFSTIPYLQARTTMMSVGDFKKRGFLHEYVEVWTEKTNWRILECTSGQIFPLGCVAYKNYKYDSNQYNRCTISSSSFWNECWEY